MSWLKKLDEFLDKHWHAPYSGKLVPKATENPPVWGKQGEWVKFPTYNTEDRRVFHVDVGNCSPEKAEELLAKMREKLNGEKCCGKEVELKKCETNCCATPDATDKPTDLFFVKAGKPLRAVVLVYLDVGLLSPEKVEAYVERRKQQWQGLFERMPEDVGVMYLPARPPTTTRVEFLWLTNGSDIKE